MDRNAKSCTTCAHTCWLVHGRMRSSPVVSSFFKVMLGDEFSKVLFLPPKFASEMWGLVGEYAFLEDSNGKQWKVTVSNVNGSLAFHQGWSNFASSHDLEIGDFVVFFQLMESLFVVKIYDRTACERVTFGKKGYKRKMMRNDNSFSKKDGPPHTSNTSCSDIKVYRMIDRNVGEEQGEDRIFNFDLSLFEKWSYSGREGKSNTCVTSGLSPFQAVKSVASGALPSKKDSCITPTSWHLVPFSVATKGNNQSKLLVCQKQGPNNDNRQSAQKNFSGVLEASSVPTSIGTEHYQSGKRMKVIKEGPMEIISDPFSQEAIQKPPGASNTPASIGTKDCQSGKLMKVNKEEPVEIKSICNGIINQNVCGGPMKLTKGEYFRNISMNTRHDGKVAQAVKADIVGQVVKTDRVAHVVKVNRVVAQVSKTDRVGQVAKTDRVAQMVKTESVLSVGTENCQSAKVPKVIKKEPIENKAPWGESLGVTKDALRGSRVPQAVVKTESIDFDRSSPTFLPRSRFPQVAVKTEIIDLDELPDHLPLPTTKGRASRDRRR